MLTKNYVSNEISFFPCLVFVASFICNEVMGVRRGGQEGPPPLSGQNTMIFNFFEENGIFLGVLRQMVCFAPPLPGKFCPPLEKNLRTPINEVAVAVRLAIEQSNDARN